MTTGIPTMYGGIEFRSRNEARWAAFFDLLGWQWEYEPFDADGYIPDFALVGEWPVLVDVKPTLTIDDLFSRCQEVLPLVGSRAEDVLVVGATPLPADGGPGALAHFGTGPLGVLVEGDRGWTSYATRALWHRCVQCRMPAFHHAEGSFAGRPCSHWDGDGYLGPLDEETIRSLWAAATNAVKWRPT